jgi:predicted lactoylglutathione lyase
MNVKATYINLPIKNISKTRAFWTKLGFSFNEQFSDDKALCLDFERRTNLFHACYT